MSAGRIMDKDESAESFFDHVVFFKPFFALAGNPKRLRGLNLFPYSLRHALASVFLFGLFFLLMESLRYMNINIYGINASLAGRLIMVLAGFPTMAGTVYFGCEAVRLFVFAITGSGNEDKMEGIARIVVVIGGIMYFCGNMYLMVSINAWFAMKYRESIEHEKLIEEQKLHLKVLDSGAKEWNGYLHKYSVFWISLEGMVLDSKNFSGYDFCGVKFNTASLKNTVFDKADLSYAKFDKADCTGASFRDATFTGASFVDCILDKCDFTGAYIDKKALSAVSSKSGIVFDMINDPLSIDVWRAKIRLAR